MRMQWMRRMSGCRDRVVERMKNERGVVRPNTQIKVLYYVLRTRGAAREQCNSEEHAISQ